MRIGCIGMASVDTALFVDRPEYEAEAVLIAKDVNVSLGGKGLIAALGVSSQGVEIAPLCLIGHESRLLGMLPSRIRQEWLLPALTEDSRIWLSVAAAQHVVAWVVPGHQIMADSDLEEAARRYVESVDTLYLAFEAVPLLRAALESAGQRGIPLAANLSRPLIESLALHDRGLLQRLVSQAALLLCNSHESDIVLQELRAHSWSEVVAAGAEVVVTRGEHGGEIARAPFQRWQHYDAVSPPCVRSVVGAGDTFNGAFVAARWAHGLSAMESCQRAAALAAECVAVPGSSIIVE